MKFKIPLQGAGDRVATRSHGHATEIDAGRSSAACVGAQNLLAAIVLSLAVTLLISYFIAGIGPWETSHFVPSQEQRDVGRVVRLLKSNTEFVIDMSKLDPLITIPSWHTILAILIALAMRPVRIAGPLAAVWSTLIVVSTLTTGWHYLVDVIAGLALAFGSHFFAQRFMLPHIVDRADA